MTRIVIVAESGSRLAELTSAVARVPGAWIVRHLSGARPLDRVIVTLDPDVVVMDDSSAARLDEIRSAAPAAQVIVACDAESLADSLADRAGAMGALACA